MFEKAILIHNVRSAHNVGAIMRTADGAGVSRVYLSGYTPQPVDRFGRADRRLSKTALGAETMLEWEYSKDASRIIRRLKKDDWDIFGIELDPRARDYRDVTLERNTLFILGNEVRGLSPALKDACDVLIEIPMKGEKESLNVAVAAGIVLFRFSS